MTWWEWTLVGVAIFVPCWRATLRDMLTTEGTTVGGLLCWSVFALAFVWTGPFFLIRDLTQSVGARSGNSPLLTRDATALSRKVAGETRRAKAERQEREMEERERWIAEKEKELGIT